MDLGNLLRQISGLVDNQTRQAPDVDTDGLLGQIGGLFRQHADTTGQILPASQDPQFRRSLGVLLGPPILEGNKIEVLVNGDEIFTAMLEAIRGAKETITHETYIYWAESIGREFSDALSERARAGVKVHLMLDFMGSIKMNDELLQEMKDAGVLVQR